MKPVTLPDHLGDVPPTMRLYTVPEAMALLRFSRGTIYALMERGRLRYVTEGRSRRIPGTAIAEYIARLEQEAEAAA
ncbi:helix-turn-helix domain-containing protein [Actinomadura miaoliensis]|uniref:Helix-turn-helix domain-containing protein n=1 Tax=Actinomadura miaoliensis TaxID=430685 RepID=A0ABP7V5C4_9ACTN